MDADEVERFKRSTRILHWTVAVSAIVLAVTGMCFFVNAWGFVAEDSYTRVIHRVAAVVLMVAPVLYFAIHAKNSLKFLKDAFVWDKDDWKWLKKAPDYYFGGDPKGMPPQNHINTGQKAFWLVCILCSVGFMISGLIMWTTGTNGAGGFLWAAIIHDLCLIVGGAMVVLHVYLGAMHPKMTESLHSMVTGKASVEYVEEHHKKWYKKEVVGKG